MGRGSSLLVLLAGSLALLLGVQSKSYTGYQLIQVQPKTQGHVDLLKKLGQENYNLDFWTDPRLNGKVDINVSPLDFNVVAAFLAKEKLPYLTMRNDMQRLIDDRAESNRAARASRVNAYLSEKYPERKAQLSSKGRRGAPSWLRREASRLEADISLLPADRSALVGIFARHDEVNNWINSLATSYPEIASVRSIGRTYEDKDTRIIKISGNPNANKPVIWIDATIHAREWLTGASAVWIIDYLTSNYGRIDEVTDLVNHYEWHILPIANPDGYEYSHKSDRLWRKTRTPTSYSWCQGVDPNRNFDMQWGLAGTSTYPCSATFGGTGPFTEECTKNMRSAINALASRMVLYMSVHSYSQLWLTPWGCCNDKPSDYSEMLRVGNIGNNALQDRHNKNFIIGTPPDILYEASGGAYDWVKSVAGVEYSYTLELRPPSGSRDGFVVAESEIIPSGQEVWDGIKAIAEELK